MSTIEFRVENKYFVSDLDLSLLTHRLSAVMQQDIHQSGDCYEIRSIYFDDIRDSCMDDNDAGVDCRQKYRIRTYGPDLSVMNLEIKAKQNGLTNKTACRLTADEYECILQGGDGLSFGSKKPLNRLLLQMRCAEMQPKVIITYERTAYVHPTGNVRITFDRNIMANRNCAAFFDARIAGSIPVLPVGMHILEVKYDEFLPDVIAKQLEIGKLQQTAFSKYYLGRLAVNGEFPITK